MKLMEIYPCYQGEGMYTGTPSVLVRFFGCNLHCVWCDTAYSINPKLHEELNGPEIRDVDPWTLTKEISTYQLPVILTGGEPTIQSDLPILLKGLIKEKLHVTVETNGTRYVPVATLDALPGKILWSVSPKMQGAQTGPLELEVLKEFSRYWWISDLQFKFVITSPSDLEEAKTLLDDVHYPHEYLVVLQPESSPLAESYDAYMNQLAWLEHRVMFDSVWRTRNVRVLPQLHALIHGLKVRNV